MRSCPVSLVVGSKLVNVVMESKIVSLVEGKLVSVVMDSKLVSLFGIELSFVLGLVVLASHPLGIDLTL